MQVGFQRDIPGVDPGTRVCFSVSRIRLSKVYYLSRVTAMMASNQRSAMSFSPASLG